MGNQVARLAPQPVPRRPGGGDVVVGDVTEDFHKAFRPGVEIQVEQHVDVRPEAVAKG